MTQKRAGFLRTASGITRVADLKDVFGINVYNTQMGLSVLWLLLWGPLLYPGGNLVWGTLLGAVGGIITALTWGFLTMSLPRSGGDYVYTTRIIHPAIGFASSFSWVCWVFLWTGSQAAWSVNPGLSTLFALIGKPDWAAEMSNPLWIFAIGAIIIIASSAILCYGLKRYFQFQLVVFTLGVISVGVAIAVVGLSSHSEYISAWNAVSAQYGSLDYQGILDAGKSVSTAPSLGATIGLLPITAFAFAYVYYGAYFGGEIKRVERNVLLGQVGGAVFVAASMLIAAVVFESVLGYDFLSSVVYAWANGLGYTIPFQPNFTFLASVLTSNPILLAIMGLNILMWTVQIPMLCLVGQTRAMLAYSMDRLIPGWFGKVSDRLRAPVNSIIFFGGGGLVFLYVYTFWPMTASYTQLMGQMVATFLVVGIDLMIFPFSRRAKHVYEVSPIRALKVGGVPAATLLGAAYVVYVLANLYFFATNLGLGAWHLPSFITSALLFAGGLIWFYGARWYRKKQGIDLDLLYAELPPE